MKRFAYSSAVIGLGVLVTSLVAVDQTPKASISDGMAKSGVLTEINDPFMDNVGRGSIVATEIAVEEFGGKVLGYPVQVVSADRQNKANMGSARVREWLDRHKVDAVTELGSSEVAVAAMRIARSSEYFSIT